MKHPIPRELNGEERILSISFLDLYLSKAGMVYNGAASLISGVIGKLTNNVVLFFILFIGLNIAVYPLGQHFTPKNKFDGGNIRLDKYLIKKYRYKKKHNIYIRNK